MKRRVWPAPLLSVGLFIAWLMLAGSLSAGNLLLAALLAWLLPLMTLAYRPGQTRLRVGATALRLAAVVLRDIVLSNIEVARRVLGPVDRIHPRFVWVPLTLRDGHAIATLAGIITMTPGTLSSEITDDRRHLLVHALHCPDDEAAVALVADIKRRYEAPLLEIFE